MSEIKFFLESGEQQQFTPPETVTRTSHVKTFEEYARLHAESLNNPQEFWSEVIKKANFKFPTLPNPENFFAFNFDVRKGPVYIKWMPGATTNVCYNCLDRNVENGLGEKIAFYWYVAYFKP